MIKKHLTKLKSTFRSQLTQANSLTPPKASPDVLLGELFRDIQLLGIHPDSKTFTDLVPAEALRKILKTYQLQRQSPDFDVDQFVHRYFENYLQNTPINYQTVPGMSADEHINVLWNVLSRETYRDRGSLMALPYPYVVPGGRFSEQFYWDSYFVMLGLAACDRDDLIDDMMKNFAYMIRKIGYIPTGNRTYLLSRSQPPFFSHMVRLHASRQKHGKRMMVRYLPYLLAEYRFWMRGKRGLEANTRVNKRLVQMPDGSILNRYYDSKNTPRPESYKEDVETARNIKGRLESQVYLDLRAACESGWDFSSRWFKDGKNIETIHTTQLIPVDLNCLLYQLEMTIADCYKLLKQPLLSKPYELKARKRAEAIQKYCWSEEKGFYFDYDFVAGKQTEAYTLAGVFPLHAGIADQKQANFVANTLKHRFLQPGGLLTTLTTTPEQWDAPNGWAPLQWIAIQSLRSYGFNELANEVKERWINTNIMTFDAQRKMVEKYNVVNPSSQGGGGEYQLQDGFGWTNGVLASLLAEEHQKKI